MRTRIYVDGHPQWSENVPAEHIAGHAYSLGGHAIEPAVTLTEKERAALSQLRYKEKKLRGENLR